MSRERTTTRTRRALAAASTLLVSIGTVGCATGESDEPADQATAGNGSATGSDAQEPDSDVAEADAPTPRLAATYDGGILVLDGTTLDVVDTIELDGFNRLNPAGDGRHVVVSTDEAFRVLDLGVWREGHGDHDHYYVADPELTQISFDTDRPGHVVHHGGTTVLFSDGTGVVESFEAADLADGQPGSETYTADEPHHGVAVELDGGDLLVTIGDEEERTGAKVLDSHGHEVARNEQCPGVHGEAMAADEVVVIGCTDGVLIYRDGEFSKVDSPDDYGRIGNQAGTEESTVVLGDYKVDPDAELERPERVSLIDTTSGSLELVDLGTSYSFRSLARGPDGTALVLGTDGHLHLIDPDEAEVIGSVPVTGQWREPVEWQQPRPTIHVQSSHAYVTEPDANQIHLVDLEELEVAESADLPQTPNELTGVPG